MDDVVSADKVSVVRPIDLPSGTYSPDAVVTIDSGNRNEPLKKLPLGELMPKTDGVSVFRAYGTSRLDDGEFSIDSVEVVQGEDIRCVDDAVVVDKGSYHLAATFMVWLDDDPVDEVIVPALYATLGNNSRSLTYTGTTFDMSMPGNVVALTLVCDFVVDTDDTILHLRLEGMPESGEVGEDVARVSLDQLSIHKIAAVIGESGGGSGDCNVFIGDVDTTFAEWKAAADAGKALMFSYSFGVGDNTLVINPMQTKVSVLPTGIVVIGCPLAIMDETCYIEMWVRHDSETDEDILIFTYFGMLMSGRATLTVDIDTWEGEPTMLGLLALPGLDPTDIFNGDFDPSDYTTAQLNAAILLGFVKMRTEFDWLLVESESGKTRDAYIPVPEDKLIGGSESLPALCRFHRGWAPDDNSDGPPTIKYRKVQAVLTYDHDLDEEVLTFPITPIYMNFETDPEA